MMSIQSRWRRHANQVITEVLRSLPSDATPEERRAACERAYPFGERRYLPYKRWREAMRAQFGDIVAKKPKGQKLPRPAPTGNETVDRLLAALRDQPDQAHLRLILADAVEEFLGKDAMRIRTVQPEIEDVARRLGFRRIATWSHIADMIEGRTLLVDPEIVRAAEIERSAAVLRMFTEVLT